MPMLGYFNKRAETPIETRGYGKFYFVLSGLLFIGTMWSVVDEISTRRPWKDYQIDYLEKSETFWREKAAEGWAGIDSAAFLELEASRDSLTRMLGSAEFTELMGQVDRLDREIQDASREVTFAKSKGDEAYYFWKKSIHDGDEDEGLKAEVEKAEAGAAHYTAVVDSLGAQKKAISATIEQVRLALREKTKALAALTKDIDESYRREGIASSAPVLIRQVMSNNFDRSNFGIPKARIDRCQTCHLGWNDKATEGLPQPYGNHPLPELMAIHNPEQFGCTPCHRGQGPALTEGLAHGEDDHYWEWPLLRGKEVYASCSNCHEEENYLRYGDRFNTGRQILMEAGCFGCHEIKGFTGLPRIGPELNDMPAKVKPEWLVQWVMDPKGYNPHTRMPDFKFDRSQAVAIASHLWKLGKENPSGVRNDDWRGGNSSRGEKLVGTVGCKGCHVVGDDVRMREKRGFSYDIAPELSRAGSKLDPAWLFGWLKDPRSYRKNATMPNLRLTDQEAKDIVAYLMTLKGDRPTSAETFDLTDPSEAARGFKLIREYGCAGCHTIKGLENESRVSVSLSNFGRKRVDELDFGDTKVPHSWDDWFAGKLTDARQYTTDRIISKMPVFTFADSEIVALRTLFRGMTKEIPELEYRRKYDARMQHIEAGRRLTKLYNCVSCHVIEELGGSIQAVLEGEGTEPPFLLPEGSKVQEQWLHEFLKSPSTIRPWLTVRMPTFGLNDDEITKIMKYFLALHDGDLAIRDYAAVRPDPAHVKLGKTLFTDLQCLSCHYTGTIPEGKEPADLAPDLSLAKNRLKPEWIDAWIAKPDSIQPGTRMPSFFPELDQPSYYSDELGGDVRAQIKAIREYLLTIPSSR